MLFHYITLQCVNTQQRQFNPAPHDSLLQLQLWLLLLLSSSSSSPSSPELPRLPSLSLFLSRNLPCTALKTRSFFSISLLDFLLYSISPPKYQPIGAAPFISSSISLIPIRSLELSFPSDCRTKMDDVKDKVKGFMKKVNNPFSSSPSGKFKGQGRVLGSSSSSSSTPTNSNPTPRPIPTQNLNPKPTSSSTNPRPLPQKTTASEENRTDRDRKPGAGFDPFDSFVTSSKRSQNGYTLNVYECPICGKSFRSEEEVSEHVDSCLSNGNSSERDDGNGVLELQESVAECNNDELEVCVGTYVSGKPSEGSVDVVLKLLRNIDREPENAKFRKIRLSNPKIKEAVGEVAGGVELLSFLGFELNEESGETWAVMEVPSEEQIRLIKKAVVLVESQLVQETPKIESLAPVTSAESDTRAEPKPIDRQVKVFFAVPESVAAKIELPDSFYKLSVEEVRREAELRRKKIEESQLLIPKSLKEKQAKAARKRYTKTIIRIQFPDGVVLQGVFSPWEPTTALYEFVTSALKEPCLEFELIHPVPIQRRVIPHFSKAGEKAKTLEDEGLVPSALIKFKPCETDSVVFTGLRNELLEISEPLL